MYALNFYSPLVADQLRSLRKTATIRLGDKSGKYRKGMIVQVLAGARYSPREKIFDAVIDKIEVKTLSELSPREIEHDNPEIRRPEDMAHFLSQLYNREVTLDDTVTVIRFSEDQAASGALTPGQDFLIRTPSCSGGLSGAAARSSQSHARRPKRSARHTRDSGARISPPHCGQSAGNSSSQSSK